LFLAGCRALTRTNRMRNFSHTNSLQHLGSCCAMLLIVFALAGCGSATSTTPPVTPPETPPPVDTSSNAATDNFARADGNLGSNWSVLSNFGGSDGGIQILNNAFAPTDGSQTGFPTSIGTWIGPSTFGPNQYAKVEISAISPEQSVVAISGATLSGANTIYNYTLTSGQALKTPQPINITGMADIGNNGNFVISDADSGTFTVPNGNGVTDTSQTGTGISATDSLGGPAVRTTAGVLNGYFVYIGNNSGYVAHNNGQTDGRVYVRELWKFVDGNASEVQQVATDLTIPDAVGDVYYLFALGNKVSLYKNNVFLATDVDTSLATGRPGIITSSATGAGHTTPLGANAGVSGMQFTNWVGSSAPSTPSGWVAQATETFLVPGNTAQKILAPNPPWSQVPGFTGVPIFQKTGETQFSGTSSLIYTGRTWANDQSSSIVASTVLRFTSLSLLVRASSTSETFYLGEFHFNNGFGPGTFSLTKLVDGVSTSLATLAGSVNFADVLRLEVMGSTLTFKQNGATVLTANDSDITGGSPGVTGGGNALIMFWEGDELASQQ
jgi:hypothetical protein